jgi:hypothetical protein
MSRRRSRIPGSYRQRTLLLLPSIPDELGDEVKDALALRNACSVEGRCPDCGAVGVITADASCAGIFHLTFEHESDCGALTDEALG